MKGEASSSSLAVILEQSGGKNVDRSPHTHMLREYLLILYYHIVFCSIL